MPTYEHICQNGHEFEEFQSIVAPPIELCPICGAPAHRKISGGSGLIFKGSGFYLTDYVKKNSSPGKSETVSETKSSPAAGETGTAKSDNKP